MSFQQIPKEIFHHEIVPFCHKEELINLSQVNKYLNEWVERNYFDDGKLAVHLIEHYAKKISNTILHHGHVYGDLERKFHTRINQVSKETRDYQYKVEDSKLILSDLFLFLYRAYRSITFMNETWVYMFSEIIAGMMDGENCPFSELSDEFYMDTILDTEMQDELAEEYNTKRFNMITCKKIIGVYNSIVNDRKGELQNEMDYNVDISPLFRE